MSTIERLPTGSLRAEPVVQRLLQTAQSRHLNAEEQEAYLKALPGEAARLRAAQQVMAVEAAVISQTVDEILSIYPFEEFHGYGREKCIRDVTLVSVYATLTMLCNDTDWLKDKFLLWMRTIVQSFGFPTQADAQRATMLGNTPNPFPELTRQAAQYPDEVMAIFDTYSRMRLHYKAQLTEEHWALMAGPLDTVVEVLAESSEPVAEGARA